MNITRAGDGSLRVVDLLIDFATLTNLTAVEIERRHWLDAYLLAAGANQVAADELHPDPLRLQRAAVYVNRGSSKPKQSAALLLAAGQQLSDFAVYSRPRWHRWQQQWAETVVSPLARQVAAPRADNIAASASEALARAAHLAPASLRNAVLKLPSCFHSFDQRPEDVRALVDKFVARWPRRERAVAVVGIRSSGAYLSPLAHAYLDLSGFVNISELTLRPGRTLHAWERNALQRVASRGGLALILDDPPRSGASLLDAARLVERCGFSQSQIVVLVALFQGSDGLPDSLANYERVILPWRAWAIHELLTPSRVCTALAELLPDRRIVTVSPASTPMQRWSRSHTCALFTVETADAEKLEICAESVGTGYFGTHVAAVAERLPDFVPRILGIRDGILFREWLPSSTRLDRTSLDESVAPRLANYVAVRSQRLALHADNCLNLVGRDAAWELAANILESSFGARGRRLARPFVRAVARRVLRSARPAVVDGATSLDHFFYSDGPPGIKKTSFAERDFSNLDGLTRDPVFDVAGCVTLLNDSGFAQSVRTEYQRATQDVVDPERWLLNRLVQAHLQLRVDPDNFVRVEDDAAQALREYIGEVLLADCEAPATGPVCALDIDGVLEADYLGFPGLSPGAALGLRALARHQYRCVVVTGRALDEVVDRCRRYPLAGGVAEYGAAVYHGPERRTTDLLDKTSATALACVRARLRETDGVRIHEGFLRAVRAYTVRSGFTRHGLAPSVASALLEELQLRDRVRAISGQGQTDFMAARIDKASGLEALLKQMNCAEPALAMAIGDSESDLPVLRMANRAFAPANADARVVSAGISRTRASFQCGFLESVEALLGHPAGKCARCRPPDVSQHARLLLAILSAADNPGMSKLRAIAQLSWLLSRQARRITA